MWEKEKMLVISIFFFSDNVLYPNVLYPMATKLRPSFGSPISPFLHKTQKMSVRYNSEPGLNHGSWKLGEFSNRQQPEKSWWVFGTHSRVTGNKTFLFLPHLDVHDAYWELTWWRNWVQLSIFCQNCGLTNPCGEFFVRTLQKSYNYENNFHKILYKLKHSSWREKLPQSPS